MKPIRLFTVSLNVLVFSSLSHAVVDIHLHAFSGKTWGKQIAGEEIIKELDVAKINQGMVISAGYFGGFLSLLFGRSYDKVRLENDYVAELVQSHPERLMGACGVHPFDEWARKEAGRCARDLGFRAVKVHANAQRINLLNKNQRIKLQDFVAYSGQLGMIVIVHAYGKSLDFNRELYRFAAETPKTTFVFFHAFGEHLLPLVEEINQGELKRSANAWIDISGTVFLLKDSRVFVDALRKFGLDRVLFGSDFPVYTPKATLDALDRLPLSREEINQILRNDPFAP